VTSVQARDLFSTEAMSSSRRLPVVGDLTIHSPGVAANKRQRTTALD